jgi:hypothetical protein
MLVGCCVGGNTDLTSWLVNPLVIAGPPSKHSETCHVYDVHVLISVHNSRGPLGTMAIYSVEGLCKEKSQQFVGL